MTLRLVVLALAAVVGLVAFVLGALAAGPRRHHERDGAEVRRASRGPSGPVRGRR